MAIIDMFNNARDMMQAMQELRSDPIGFAARRKFNIPPGITDPNQMTQYLLNTGQIKQEQVNEAMRYRNDPTFNRMFGGNNVH